MVGNIERQIRSGAVDWIQIREKDLEARELVTLARRVVHLAASAAVKILINSRMDVALAAGAHGVHLPSATPAPSEYRRVAPASFLIGVSTHSVAEVKRAEALGADYVVLGPVFDPLSKKTDQVALGLGEFAVCAGAAGIPVIALGGITTAKFAACARAGAAGVAGITLFQGSGK